MSDPYIILGLAPDSTDAVIRRRYLQLVRQYPPERAPERFAAIREAYEKIRDPIKRMQYKVFKAGQDDSLDALLTDAGAQRSRRIPAQVLLTLGQRGL
jgi:curved DNA-binding protein CbpA